jgi:hypothetical protein
MTAQAQGKSNAIDVLNKMIAGYDAVVAPLLNQLQESTKRVQALGGEFYKPTQSVLGEVQGPSHSSSSTTFRDLATNNSAAESAATPTK